MSQPPPTPDVSPLSPAETAHRGRLRWRRRIIGYSILAMLVVPPLFDVLSDPAGEVADWYYAAALESYASGRPNQAEKHLIQSLEWSPRTAPRVHTAHAQWQISRANYEEAVGELSKAMETGGETIPLLLLRADCYQRLKQPEKAVADWDRVRSISMEPTLIDRLVPPWGRAKQAELLNAVAYARAVGNVQLQEGLQQANESLALVPEKKSNREQRAMVLDTRGFLHYRLGNHEAAVEDFNQAVDILEGLLQDNSDELLKDEPNESIRDRRYRALQTHVNRSLVVMLYHRALAHEALGRESEASADLRRVRGILGREPNEMLY